MFSCEQHADGGLFFIIFNLTSKKFKKLVIEIMTHFAYDNFNVLMCQYERISDNENQAGSLAY